LTSSPVNVNQSEVYINFPQSPLGRSRRIFEMLTSRLTALTALVVHLPHRQTHRRQGQLTVEILLGTEILSNLFRARSHCEPGYRTRYSDWLRAGRLRDRGSSPGRVKNSHFSMLSRPALGSTQPPVQWVPGALSQGVNLPEREANHLPPTSAEVKKMWIYTSTPPYSFMA
jgi:hypothetical protein